MDDEDEAAIIELKVKGIDHVGASDSYEWRTHIATQREITI